MRIALKPNKMLEDTSSLNEERVSSQRGTSIETPPNFNSIGVVHFCHGCGTKFAMKQSLQKAENKPKRRITAATYGYRRSETPYNPYPWCYKCTVHFSLAEFLTDRGTKQNFLPIMHLMGPSVIVIGVLAFERSKTLQNRSTCCLHHRRSGILGRAVMKST